MTPAPDLHSSPASAPGLDLPLYIGTYNRPGDWFTAHGRGLQTFRFNVWTGDLAPQAAFTEITNPCYLARSRDGRLLAAADHFMKPGAVHAFATDADGTPRPLSHADAQGQAVCHVCVGALGVVYAVSYMDSRLTVHEFGRDGALSDAVQLWRYTGSGPNPERQTSAHPHQAVLSPDGRHLYVPDLGSDCVHVHAVRSDGRLEPAHDTPLAAGSGPRHMVFHPTLNLAYLVGELDGFVRVLARDRESGGLRQVAAHPTTSSTQPSAAAIHFHPSGRVLAVSERSDSTLAFFEVGEDGALSFANRIAAGGLTPREFTFDPLGRWLIVGCQDSDLVAVHALDALTGLPAKFARVFACGSPVCLQF